ncbi:MAG: glycosyltransferase family 4 protein [Candidatus Eisenbacteria bacterium]
MAGARRDRVAMVGPARNVRGGVSAVVNALLGAMPDDAPEIRYVPTHVDGPKPVKALAAVVGFVRLLWAIVVWRCDLVHIHMASYASFARKSRVASIAHYFRRKVIVHVHGAQFDLFFEGAVTNVKRSITWTLMSADLVIALSDQWEEKLREIAPEARFRVLPNPVDTRRFEGVAAKRPEVPADGGRALFLGAFTQRKGIYDLIEAVALVVAKRPAFALDLGGDHEVGEVRKLVSEKGLERNVRFMGWVRGKKKAEAFARSHVFVLPSYNEGLPIAVLEALAAGLPIVTTPVGGIPEVVVDGVNGLLHEPGDVDALALSILRLLDDAELRSRMSGANLELVSARHDARVVARELVGWYNDVLTGAIRKDGAGVR